MRRKEKMLNLALMTIIIVCFAIFTASFIHFRTEHAKRIRVGLERAKIVTNIAEDGDGNLWLIKYKEFGRVSQILEETPISQEEYEEWLEREEQKEKMKEKFNIKIPTPISKTPAPKRINGSWSQNSYIRYAWKISRSKDFILTIEAESKWNPKAKNKNRNGSTDHGLCQLNSRFHSKFINSRSFDYWDKQVDYCWKEYQKAEKNNRLASTFFGYNRRHEMRERFN